MKQVQSEQRPRDRAVSVRIPITVQITELEKAHREHGDDESDLGKQGELNLKLTAFSDRENVNADGRREADENDNEVDRRQQQLRVRSRRRRPVREVFTQVKVRSDGQREHRAFDDEQQQVAPPQRLAAAIGMRRQL